MPSRYSVPFIWRTVNLRVLLCNAIAYLVSSIFTYFQVGSDLTPASYIVPIFFILPSLVVLHHLLRLWPWDYWLGIVEIICSVIETGVTAFTLYLWWGGGITTTSLRHLGILVMGVSWLFLSVTVFASFLILLWDATIDHSKGLLYPYDFSAGSCPNNCRWTFIFGKTTTKKRFGTDNYFIRWLRGGLAIICLVALSFTVLYVFIGKPLWWNRDSVIRTSKVPRGYLLGAVPNAEVEVIMDISGLQQLTQDIPLSILNVTATLSANLDSSGGLYRDRGLAIIHPPEKRVHSRLECPGATHWQQEESLLLLCPLIEVHDDDDTVKNIPLSLPLSFNLEILVTVDFSMIPNAPQEQLKIGLYPALRLRSAQTTSTDAKPIYLIPGSHLYVPASVSFAERSWSRGVAALGVPKYHLLPVLNVGHLVPDWPFPVPANGTASLRLFIPYADEIRIEREFFEDSVLNGFALVGGIWTFVNGIFVSVFGTTLLLVLFGIKPLSFCGLVHLFQSPENSLMPRKLSAEDREWIIEVLSEHMLDDSIRSGRISERGQNGAEP